MNYSEKRACGRTNVNIDITYYCGSARYSGSLVNISEKGMFISTNDMCFPIESQLEVIIPVNNEMLHVPASLRRIEMSPDSHDGLGLEFRQLTPELSVFLDGIRAVK